MNILKTIEFYNLNNEREVIAYDEDNEVTLYFNYNRNTSSMDSDFKD